MSSWRGQTAQGQFVPAQAQEQNNGPRAKCDQVVFEAIAKAAEIVVGSRCWIENVSGSNSSSRFNLLVPEVQGVRSILHRWKRALHVPLRLDVFYQHDDGRRELLERWCLEYAPKTTYSYPNHPSAAADPIVQLRKVCKQIVVWLRTLYGWSRMLPAQALRQRQSMGSDNHVGFSIYVVSEGNDDVTGLIANQGFLSQGQPHSVLTPYGELGWKVFYTPESMVRQLVPEQPRYSTQQSPIATPTQQQQSRTQPIPMGQLNTTQSYSSNPNHHMVERSPEPSVARSAPTKKLSPGYYRSNSDVSGSFPQKAPMMNKTMRRNSDMPTLQQKWFPISQQNPLLQRIPGQVGNEPQHTMQQPMSTKSKPPTKNLSALSLAMLNDKANADGETREAAEKRRAALHHAPPQFSNTSKNTPPGSSPILKPSNLATAGEYGYGYNNKLPNLKATSPAAVARSSFDSRGSPGPLPSTPLSSTPTGFLLGAAPTPPPNVLPPLSTLIPPRSNVTPPFVRPAGFVGEPPSQLLPPPAATGTPSEDDEAEGQQHSRNHQTSLDLLQSSPFQRRAVAPIMDDELRQAFNLNDLMPPNIMGTGLMKPQPRLDDVYYDQAFGYSRGAEDEDDMPFAVDSYTSTSHVEKRGSGADVGSSSEAASTHLLSSVNGMASFCSAPPKRLALFASVGTAPQNGVQSVAREKTEDEMIMSIADELAEFKTFGASIMMGGDASGSSGNSAPISLRP